MASDFALAMLALMRQPGMTREEAAATLVHDGVDVAGMAARERERLGEERQAEEDAKHARSPEGRRERGRELREARQARTEDLELARELLREEAGLSEEELSTYEEGELLHASGIDRSDPALWSIAERDAATMEMMHSGEYARMSETEQREAQKFFDFTADSAVNYLDSISPKVGDGLDGDAAGDGAGAEGGGDGGE